MTSPLILPSEIPWAEIKGSSLEELLYWLFDSMGAKELEWRIGGKGSGTADQGRDLELVFFTPSPDGTLTKQTWWVEAKGRSGTVEPSEVHEAVLNAAGKNNVEVLVIATNTNFSNPTRDWVKDWQRNNRRPVIKLWERTELENLCSKNPLAVIRLHSKALSSQGRLEVVSAKLWDYATYSDEPTLMSLWKQRDSITIDERSLLALAASESANGDLGVRSWALLAPDATLAASLCTALINSLYLAFRAGEHGVRQEPLLRAISYLILIATQRLGNEAVASLLANVWDDVEGWSYPDKVREFILEPVFDTLQAELRDVCSSKCRRVSTEPVLLQDIEIEGYWRRLSLRSESEAEVEPKRILTIEAKFEPCQVGLSMEGGCPLCNVEKPHTAINEFLEVAGRVVKFRANESSDA